MTFELERFVNPLCGGETFYSFLYHLLHHRGVDLYIMIYWIIDDDVDDDGRKLFDVDI